ncbi:MAG: 3-keto-5-aminohexanoate cleavage protein, partial [Gemmatimonadetes bacterium]|nr:3-keto-5-aminohexanoate cleavage protein [Gemmatimonadota bacterium]
MSSLPDHWNYADAFAYLERVGRMPPTIICVACNGGVQGKEANPNLPETPEEIAESVQGAHEAGATMVHVHARQEEHPTRPAVTTERWLEVNRRIREACPDIIINDTTGGGPDMTMDERLQCLDAGPEVASLNLTPDMSRFRLRERPPPLPDPRPEVLYDECLPFSYGLIERFASEMKKRGIKPELETYHTGGGWVIRFLIEEGLVEKPYWIQTVMGYQTSSLPTVDNVLNLVREFPEETLWLTSGIGPHQLPMTTLATMLGGHVRVGLEDNVYYARGRKADSNRQLVERAVRISHELNRDVATPVQAREMLGLSATPSQYA